MEAGTTHISVISCTSTLEHDYERYDNICMSLLLSAKYINICKIDKNNFIFLPFLPPKKPQMLHQMGCKGKGWVELIFMLSKDETNVPSTLLFMLNCHTHNPSYFLPTSMGPHILPKVLLRFL